MRKMIPSTWPGYAAAALQLLSKIGEAENSQKEIKESQMYCTSSRAMMKRSIYLGFCWKI